MAETEHKTFVKFIWKVLIFENIIVFQFRCLRLPNSICKNPKTKGETSGRIQFIISKKILRLTKKARGQGCFIDLQKAFDTLYHEILMFKLDTKGFKGKIDDIIGCYLSNIRTNTPFLSVETGSPGFSLTTFSVFALQKWHQLRRD